MPLARWIAIAAALAVTLTPAVTAAQPLAAAAAAPRLLRQAVGGWRLVVQGKPFLVRGGELGNSSAGTAAQADSILPRLAAEHFNTVLMPVAWNEIEPAQGRFDFSIPDHWIAVARRQHLRLVLLWFGSWKNAFSSYAPEWVLADDRRFPRALAADGTTTQILSVFGEQTLRGDSMAFAALMRHVRDIDSREQTVIMVQVENEVGYVGLGGRDRSADANHLFAGRVPPQLLAALQQPGARLSGTVAEGFDRNGSDWAHVFGPAADEAFMAWYYARFSDQVTQAGKREYPLPMYMNAQLPAPRERAGDYPSGGPYPSSQPIYRAAAPAIDFYAPDIYWPDFERWVDRYQELGNPAFVPESRPQLAPYDALYVFGQVRGFGFSAFGVDAPATAQGAADTPVRSPQLADVYATLAELGDRFLQAQAHDATRALILHLTGPRPTQTVALGGYLFRAALSKSWPAQKPLAADGAMLVMQAAPGEFYVLGSGLTVTFLRDPDADDTVAGIGGIEQLAWRDGRWNVVEEMNGDQSDQGRGLIMDAHTIHLYRVRLYTYHH